jgi:hypothetical protein
MTVAEAVLGYELAKREYQRAGKLAKDKPRDSVAWENYDRAKHEYHRAGDALRRVRRQAA